MHRNRSGKAVRAHDRDDGRTAILVHRERRPTERERAISIVIHNRQHRTGDRTQRARHRRVAQLEIHRAIRIDQRVIPHRHRDEFRRNVAGGPNQRVGGPGVMHPVGRRAVRGRDLHRQRADVAPAADDSDHRHATGLANRVIRAQETHVSRRKVVIDDRQKRVRSREADAARRIGEHQPHDLIRLDDGIVDDRHEERIGGLARGKRERAGDGLITPAERRGAAHEVGSVIRVNHPHGPARAGHGNDRVARPFIDDVGIGIKTQQPAAGIRIDNRHRAAGHADGRAQRGSFAYQQEGRGGRVERHVQHLVAGDLAVVDDVHEHVAARAQDDVAARFAGGPSRVQPRAHVVHTRHRRPRSGGRIKGDEIRRRIAQGTVGPGQRDVGRAGILIHRVIGLGELNVTRSRRRTRDHAGEVTPPPDVRALGVPGQRELVGALEATGDPARSHGCQRNEARPKITGGRRVGIAPKTAANDLERAAHHQIPAQRRVREAHHVGAIDEVGDADLLAGGRFEGHATDEISRQRVGEIDDARKLIVGHVHERRVQRTIGEQPRHADAPRVVEIHEQPTGHRPERRGIHRQRVHRGVEATTRIERGVQTAVRVEPRNLAAEPQVHVVEIPADDHLLRTRWRNLRRRTDHRRQVAIVLPRGSGVRVVALINDDPEGAVGRRPKRNRDTRGAVGQTRRIQRHRRRTPRHAQMIGAQINVDGVWNRIEVVVQREHPRDQRTGRSGRRHRHDEVKNILRKPARRRAVDRRVDDETIRDHRQTIVQREREHGPVRTRAGIEGQIQRPRRAQPRDAAPRNAIDDRELTANDDLAVRLNFHGVNRTIRATARIEARVERTIGIQARDVIAVGAVEEREFAADDHLAEVDAVGVDRQRAHGAVRAETGIEGRIHHAVGEQTRDIIPADAVVGSEAAANNDATGIRRGRIVNPHRTHEVIGPNARTETEVQRTIGVHPRHAAALERVHRREIATHHRLAVRLHGNREDRLVGTGVWINRRIRQVIEVRVVIAIRRTGGLIVHRDH